MLTISQALSAGQARTYHAREFVSEKQNYWSRDAQVHSEWQGRLAQEWGLRGSAGVEEFVRLSEGQHPANGAQLVKHQPAKTYDNEYGKEITSVEHRAGWDATFSAPKSVSLTALVGGDERVREAHRESVRVALGELERYAQARIGNVHAPETTGKFIAATFEHDTARPVDGYAAPQLHTHAVIFNMTERENGQTRALQERSLFQSQQYATSVYRSELAMRLQGFGYEVERGKHGQPEIKGYTQEYLDASSPRREQIKNHLEEIRREGAGAAQVAAHRTRDSKEIRSPEEVLQRHRELAARHGNQADLVVAQARDHTQIHAPHSNKTELQPERQAVTYARNHVFERTAVQDERSILQAAISRSMAQATYEQVRNEFAQRVQRGEFVVVGTIEGRAAPLYTTAEMVRMEKEIVGRMQSGNQRYYSDPILVSPSLRIAIEDRHTELSPAQREVVDDIFVSREKTVGLDGIAGTGKTTLLRILANSIPENERILVIEDTPELQIRKPNIVAVGCQTSTFKTNVSFDDLLKDTLRFRPDRIILGEVRGSEARTLLDSFNTGHAGSLATIHANSAAKAHERSALALRTVCNLKKYRDQSAVGGLTFARDRPRQVPERYECQDDRGRGRL